MSIDITTLALAKEYTNRMVGSGGTGGGVNGKDGITPHIGDNGNWFIGTVDTGISAQGPAGENGVTPHIGTNGNWYIGSANTGVSAKGAKGDNGLDGNGIKSAILNSDYTLTLTFDDGTTYTTPSIRGATGSSGKDGSAGAAGKDGTDGVGIASIEQTATSTADGGSNVFTVTLTNGTTATFTVKNGSKGSTGKDGSNGVDGGHYTPVVTQPTTDTMQISFAPSKPDMPAVNTVTVNLPVSENSGQNVELDTTLTQSGKAADAKAVGDKLTELGGKIPESVPNVAAVAIDYDKTVKAIAHRGYSTKAPENTLPAYIMAKQQGYHYAECDVSFTADGVAVLLHDSTIDRTSDGSGSIPAMTYDEVSQYDFGSWKSAEYAGTKIPTFAEFIKLCRGIGMHPYIELKNNGGYSQEAVAGLVGIVKSCGMGGKVTWVSYNATFLGYVKTADSSARLGYLVDTTTEDRAAAAVTTIQFLQTEENEVFANLALAYLNDTKLQHFIDAEIPVEVYYISADVADVTTKILEAHSYITGFCTDVCIAGKVLYEAYMQWSGDTTEKTLTSISAAYSGGSVPVGTAVSSLSGVTVTAHYSDGSTATVTGYTLSGSIAEGDNTVTVTYQGKTATFTVTGTSETGGGDTGGSGGEDSGGDDSGSTETPGTLVHSWDFTQGLTDSVGGYTAEPSGATQDSSGLHLTAANNFVRLCDDIVKGDVVEVDVGALNAQDWGGKHGRLICFVDWDKGYESGTGQYGIVYRNTGEWNIYKNPWGTGGVLTAVDALANKTVRIDTGTGKAYADGVLFADNNGWRNDAYYLLLGASEQAYFDAAILAVRVYRPE